jgi:ring-1,2-phenylacetyl-CoA epoxidase subunit PaaC
MSKALTDLLYQLADDDLMIGHRNSEWCGMGPLLEEDIAFASMAQDQLGHALAYFRLLESLGHGNPDQLGFLRQPAEYRAAHLMVQPNGGDYAFSLVRHFLYDHAKFIRLGHLTQSAYQPLAQLAGKLRREVKYHVLHGRTWVQRLATGTDESHLRMQSALNEAWPAALAMFEPPASEAQRTAEGLCPTEADLQTEWLQTVTPILIEAGLEIPADADPTPFMGGRFGYASEHLEPLLTEMTEVIRLDPQAAW